MKKYVFLLLCLIVALGFAYAGAGTQAGGRQQLRVMVHPFYSPQGTEQARTNYLNGIINEWRRENPNVDLVFEHHSTNSSEAMARLLEQVAGGRAPDAAMVDSFVFTNFIPYARPVDALMEKHGINKGDFFEFSQNLVSANNQSHGVMFTTDARVLYYRRDLIPNPPSTWDDLIRVGGDMQSRGLEAFLLPAGRGEGAVITSILPFFWGQGGVLIDAAGRPAFGTGENREKMLATFTFIRQLVDAGLLAQRAATYASESDLNGEIASGRVAMFLGGTWQTGQLESIIGAAELENWGAAPIPHRAGAREMSASGGWVWTLFSEDAQKQELLFDILARLYFNDQGMARWASIGSYLPTRMSVYEHPSFTSTRFTSIFRNILEGGSQLRPVAAVYPQVSSELQIALSSVVSGAKTPEQALQDAWAAVTR
jgi:multiple sugar transport system substrate-binding protein